MIIPVRPLHWLSAILAAIILTACDNSAARGPVVLAPASMQEAVSEVAVTWSEQGHAAPLLSFAGSQAQARQVEQGAPADIIITADREWMDWLEERDLIEAESRRVVAANGLMLISSEPLGPGDTIRSRLRSLGNGKLALADPHSVPAGRYARAALENMGLWEGLAARVVPAENVRGALALVETGEAELGIVYQTDAAASRRVAGIAFDSRDVPDITYSAALVTGAGDPDRKAFLDFFSSPPAQEIFAAHRFLPVEQDP